MAHDFAKTRKSTSASRRKKEGAPAWLLLLAGTLAGAFVMLLVYLAGLTPSTKSLTPTPTLTSATKPPISTVPAAPHKRTSPVFEFYSKLPDNRRAIIDPAALQQAQRFQQTQQTVLATQSSPSPSPVMEMPKPINAEKTAVTPPAAAAEPSSKPPTEKITPPVVAAATTVPASTALATSAPSPIKPPAQGNLTKPRAGQNEAVKTEAMKTAALKASTSHPTPKNTPAKTATPVVKNKARYILQAGVFHKKIDADRQRAKVLMLGMSARAQPFAHQGETWLKVWVGPFASASAMEDARIMLNGNHIQATPASP